MLCYLNKFCLQIKLATQRNAFSIKKPFRENDLLFRSNKNKIKINKSNMAYESSEKDKFYLKIKYEKQKCKKL